MYPDLDFRLLNHHLNSNEKPTLCIGISSIPLLTGLFLQAILHQLGVPHSAIIGDSKGAAGDRYDGISVNQRNRETRPDCNDIAYIGMNTEGLGPDPKRKLLTYVFITRGIGKMAEVHNFSHYASVTLHRMSAADQKEMKSFCEKENFPMMPIGYEERFEEDDWWGYTNGILPWHMTECLQNPPTLVHNALRAGRILSFLFLATRTIFDKEEFQEPIHTFLRHDPSIMTDDQMMYLKSLYPIGRRSVPFVPMLGLNNSPNALVYRMILHYDSR